MNELYHYGIKGQKWGVRRFQNKDGTLTKLGKTRKEEESNKRASGIKKIDSDTDIIKKGSKMQRLAKIGDDKINNKKYASITEDDNWFYGMEAENGRIPGVSGDPENWTVYELTAKKDIRVANGKQVVDHLVKTYGDKEVKDILKDNKNTIYSDRLLGDRKYTEKIRKLSESLLTSNDSKLNKSKEIFDHYAKKGYDAIVDPEDFISGYEYPIILLNPSESVSIRKY